MTNLSAFKSDEKFKELSSNVVSIIEKLDTVLHEKGYEYRGKWREDREPGGNVFVFEVERRRGRRKNLITLRPQKSFLKVEVYWGQNQKHLFDVRSPGNIPEELLLEIEQMYSKIVHNF
ncbi:MAG TPA: hypothetical protein PLP24_09815 [Acetivibrio thermocellus]|nr:hypothetical protein [Acetivibrio thermocellus]